MAINVNIPSQFREYDTLSAFPATGSAKILYVAKNTNKLYRWDGSAYVEVSASQASSWGSITGTLSNQTDLQSILDNKVSGVTASSPLASSGGTTPDISIPKANVSTDGYLSSSDWITFNGKQANLISGFNIKTINTFSVLGTGTISVQDTLVSGTNIKTINSASLLGSGDISITKSDVGLANVDNTSDANKPVSTATQTALNAKQNALTLTTTGTSGASTLVGSTLNIPQYGGGGGGGFHLPVKPVTGFAYSNIFISGSSTFGNSSNIMYLTPFIPLNNLTIVSASIQVTTLGAGNTMKIAIYSDNNGLPQTKLLESTALDISTIGFKTFVTSFTFTAGTTYWIATAAAAATGAITSNSQSIQIGNTLLSNGSYNGMSFTISYPTIPTTLTPISSNLASISTQPRVTFVSV